MSETQTFLNFCPQDKAEEAKAAKNKVETATATIKAKRADLKKQFRETVLTPEMKNWLEGIATLGAVVKALHENLASKGEDVKKFWSNKAFKKDTKETFGFTSHPQATKHLKVYNKKQEILRIFESCFHRLPKNLDQIATCVTKFSASEVVTEEEIKNFLKEKTEAQQKKQKKSGQKRKRTKADLEELVVTLKKRRLEAEKKRLEAEEKVKVLQEFIKAQNLMPPLFVEQDDEKEEVEEPTQQEEPASED